MSKLKTQIKVTLALGVLSLFAGLAVHLALTDIHHGEADASLEWSVVRIGAVVFLAFIGSVFFTLRRALKILS